MKGVKKLSLGLANLAVLAVIAWYAYQAWGDYLRNPWTRDGQVRGHVIQVSPRVSGMVTAIHVVDNQFVESGQLLFEIDREPFEIAIAQAEANLERARIGSEAARLQYERVQEIYRRDRGAVSQKDLERREASYRESLAQIDVASESLRAAKLNLDYTRIRASVDGYVSNIDFQIGTQAVASQPILALVDSNSFWVFGYFRETEIGQFQIGDPARVTLLAYPDRPLPGVVESLGWGIAPSDGNTGHNLLPSIKPVFQWIRLAQRVPVRIKLDPVPADIELRFGLSASVMILENGK